MVLLVVLTALMVAASAGLKLRATSRLGLGLSPLSLLEALAAIGLLAAALSGTLPPTGFMRWSIPLAVTLVVVSSMEHAVRMERRRREREQSEARRLATWIRYPTERGDQG